MKNKILIFLGIAIICSIFGYVLFSQINAKPSQAPLSEAPSQIIKATPDDIFIKTSAECEKQAKEFFEKNLKNEEGKDTSITYAYRFTKEKQCYILLTFQNKKENHYYKELDRIYFPDGDGEALAGAYDKDANGIRECQVRAYEAGVSYEWNYCQNEEEFDNLIKVFEF